MTGDEREPDEERLTERMERVMRESLEKACAPEATRRDAHAKHHGLLAGRFAVAPDLPAELRVGLFAEPKSYEAWIRCSSSSPKPRSDAVKDVRGLAIKLLDVDGEKVPESDEPRTQDFVLLSHPSMPLGTLRLFHDAVYYSLKWSPLAFAAKMLLTGHARVLRELSRARIHPTSPLEIRYWSTTPYQFGDRVVKYSLLPAAVPRARLPEKLSENYLTDAMEQRLTVDDVHFDFAVQFRAGDMPIHDAAPRWDEAVSPFRNVATLTIPRQVFRSAERDQRAEALTFSPGHARVEHRPLGSLNRARVRIYRANSDFRHQRRGLPKLHGG
jgi:hypothetical protein